jgi:hypothetical protein
VFEQLLLSFGLFQQQVGAVLHGHHLLVVGLDAIQLIAEVQLPPLLLPLLGKIVGARHHLMRHVDFLRTTLLRTRLLYQLFQLFKVL